MPSRDWWSHLSGHSRQLRRGLSLLELLGCLLAVVAGIWAGATYLDIDLRAAWQLGMEKAGVAASQARPASQGQPEAPSAPPHVATSAQAATAGVAGEAEQEQEAVTEEDGIVMDPPATSVGEATLAYWNRIQQITRHEQQTRQNAQREPGSDPGAILHVHRQSYALAAESIRQLPTRSVDPLASQLAQDLAGWYERGSELADRGTAILDEGELTIAQGPLARRWHSARKQHAEELDLLRRKSVAVRGKLAARYRQAFGELL